MANFIWLFEADDDFIDGFGYHNIYAWLTNKHEFISGGIMHRMILNIKLHNIKN